MIGILSILGLVLLLILAFFVTVTLHEVGHAIPALLMTREEVAIYIGSTGDPSKSFHGSVGRVDFYCKYNPLLWFKGCCTCADEYLSIDQSIWFFAGGPIASILLTIITWLMVSNLQQEGFFRIVFGFIFFISLMITIGNLIPNPTSRYTPSGHAIYSDLHQIFRLIRMKNGRY